MQLGHQALNSQKVINSERDSLIHFRRSYDITKLIHRWESSRLDVNFKNNCLMDIEVIYLENADCDFEYNFFHHVMSQATSCRSSQVKRSLLE